VGSPANEDDRVELWLTGLVRLSFDAVAMVVSGCATQPQLVGKIPCADIVAQPHGLWLHSIGEYVSKGQVCSASKARISRLRKRGEADIIVNLKTLTFLNKLGAAPNGELVGSATIVSTIKCVEIFLTFNYSLLLFQEQQRMRYALIVARKPLLPS
jgi:hypothetical protein